MKTVEEIQAELMKGSFPSCWALYVEGCRLMGRWVPRDAAAAMGLRRELWSEFDQAGPAQLGDLVVMSGRPASGDGGARRLWTGPGAGEKAGEHVGFCLDAFRFVHLVTGMGPVVGELAHWRAADPALHVARLRAEVVGRTEVADPISVARGAPSAGGGPITVRVVMFESLVGHRVVRENAPRQLRRAVTMAEGFRELTGVAWDPEAWVVIRNGAVVGGDSGAGASGADMLADGDELHIAPRPREITTASLTLLAIGLLASTLSTFLLPHMLNKPKTSAEAPGKQYGFDRYSRPAIAGEPMPVVLGPRKRYGGKMVASLPGEGADGNTRLRMLIDLSAGPVNMIGSLTVDTDRAAAADLSGIFLNDTPIAQFPGATVSVRMGAPGQDPIPGFDDVERLREVGVGGSPLLNTSGTDRTSGTPSAEVVNFSTDDEVDAVVVRVRFAGGLYSAGSSGQILARRVSYRVRYRTSDVGSGAGSWSAWAVVPVERAEQSPFVSAYRIDNLGLLKYDLQVERVTAEPASALTVDAMAWDSLLQVIYSSENYEGRAVIALEITAGEQLTSEPRVSVDLEGYKGVRIWDGISDPSAPTFTTGYSDNPAYLALELLTNTAWGMGTIYGDANINFPKLLEWATRCDGLVATSAGGTRKRYRCGMVIGEARFGEEWLRAICETGRAVAACAGDVWTFIEHKAQAAVEHFTEGSIAVDESTGRALAVYGRELATGGKVRPNRIVAQFEDAALDGRVNTVAWPALGTQWLDGGGAEDEAVREESIRLDGVFDAEQALAEVRFRMKRIRFLSRTLTLTPVREVVVVQPGDRFDAAIALAGWGAGSGLLVGATAASVYLDRDVTLGSGTNVIRVQHADGAVETVEILSPQGAYPAGTEILTAAFAATPAEFEEYAIGGELTVMKPFTCTRVALEDAGQLRWRVEGIEYDPAVYDETAEAPTDIVYTTLPDPRVPPGPVSDLAASDRLVDNGAGGTKLQVSLTWAQSAADAAKTAGFYVYHRLVGGETWIRSPVASVARAAAVLELTELDFAYQFKVVAFSPAGVALSPYDDAVPLVELAYGLGVAPPPPPTGLTLSTSSGVYTLTWDAVDGAAAYQVLYGGETTALPNVGAEDCLVEARVDGTGFSFGGPRLGNLNLAAGEAARFFVRSVSASGRLSWTAATVNVSSAATPPGRSIKQTDTFDLSTDGTRTNLTWDGGQSRLELTSPASDGVYLSPEVDTGSLTSSTLALAVLTANDAADPTLADAPWAMPSIEADQWGVVSGSGSTAVVGMLMPPYPDDRQEFVIEVRVHDGVIWSSWETWAHPHQGVSGMFQKWQVRVTMRRDVAPYRPALKGITGVVVH